MKFLGKIITAVLILALFLARPVWAADTAADIGMTRLRGELGDVVPTGSGVPVSQVEGTVKGHWMPDPAHAAFKGKTILDRSGDSGHSGHATSVGRIFFGRKASVAPGIPHISVYKAGHWVGTGRLQFPYWGGKPLSGPERVANHSWVGNPPGLGSEALRRLDWLVERDDFIQVAALNNGSTGKAMLGSAFNVLSVGRTDGNHPRGTAPVDDDAYEDSRYATSRTAPHLVVPVGVTSRAAPFVSAAAALLVETGHRDPALSTDPVEAKTTNRSGELIYNAERSEVIKAALMAGADWQTSNTGKGDILGYREGPAHRTGNGLDTRYGAGQVNVCNGFHILAAGEQNSREDDPVRGGRIGLEGFDFDPAFGGGNGSNRTATYMVTVKGDRTLLRASLVWNLLVKGGPGNGFDGNAVLYDLNLRLLDATEGDTLVAASESRIENTENITISLTPGHVYRLVVTAGPGQKAFRWDYALAWQLRPNKEESHAAPGNEP